VGSSDNDSRTAYRIFASLKSRAAAAASRHASNSQSHYGRWTAVAMLTVMGWIKRARASDYIQYTTADRLQ